MPGSRATTWITWGLIAVTAIGSTNLTLFAFVQPGRQGFQITAPDGAPVDPIREGRGAQLPGELVPKAELAPKPVEAAVAPRSLLYAYRVRLTADGLVTGTLDAVDPASGVPRPARDATLRFFQEGIAAGETKVGPEGQFTIKGLAVGPCAMIAAGRDGFLAFAVDVLPAKDPLDPEPNGEHPIHALLVPPHDAVVMDQIILEYLSSAKHLDERLGRFVPPEIAFRGNGPTPFGNDPRMPGVRGNAGLGRAPAGLPARAPAGPQGRAPAGRPAVEVPSITPEPFPAEFAFPDGPVLRSVMPAVKQQSVQADRDGIAVGRVMLIGSPDDSPATTETVYFIAEGKICGRAEVDRHGLIRVRGLQPRYYSIVTIGEQGFAALGIEVFLQKAVPAAPPAPLSSTGDPGPQDEPETFFVNFAEGDNGGGARLGRDNTVNFEYALIDLELLLMLLEALEEEAAGAGGGGYSGGGGGGGGGGGFDPLALLGLLGLLGLLDGGDDDNPPPPVSPFKP